MLQSFVFVYVLCGVDRIVGNLEKMFIVIQAENLVLPQHIFYCIVKTQPQYSPAVHGGKLDAGTYKQEHNYKKQGLILLHSLAFVKPS